MEFTNNLTCQCACFQVSELLENKNERKIDKYVNRELERVEYFLQEVYKHTKSCDINELRPCYGSVNTIAFVLKCSYFRHQNSIKKLENEITKKRKKNLLVQLENGNEVTLSTYIGTVKKLVNALEHTLDNFCVPSNEVKLEYLLKSENLHKTTLEIIQHVIGRSETGILCSQLGPPLNSSIGICESG